MADNPSAVRTVEGTGVAVRGNDIDTDRIIPARFLRMITFEGLGEHAFEDDRKSDPDHPFNDPRHRGTSILVVNGNFGCGSSREHAPQALQRWGVRAIVGESFAEIFRGNGTAIGMPCVTAAPEDVKALQQAVRDDPGLEISLDLRDRTLSWGEATVEISLPEGSRVSLLEGAWDATGMLLEGANEVRRVAERLPYVKGYGSKPL